MTGRKAGAYLLVALAAFAWATGFEPHMVFALGGPMAAAIALVLLAPAKTTRRKKGDNTKGAQ